MMSEEDDNIDDDEEEEEEEEEEDDDHDIQEMMQHDSLPVPDVVNPWIQPPEPPRREPVMPVPVADLLADGGGGGAAGRGGGQSRAVALATTLSFRTKLRREILSGNIGAATAMLQKERPGLLERRADVRFALKCQEFIELVKKREVTAAVSLAQRDLSRFRDSPRTRSDSPSSFSSSSSAAPPPSPNGSPFHNNGHHLDNNKPAAGGSSAPTNSCASSPASSATTAGFGQAGGARGGASPATARSGGVNTRGAAQRR
ncbi:unnamed protein product, partial [Ectocarpus fasciculatus]